jgi:hypothetical protein
LFLFTEDYIRMNCQQSIKNEYINSAVGM